MAITRRIRGHNKPRKSKQLVLSYGAFKRMSSKSVLREVASK